MRILFILLVLMSCNKKDDPNVTTAPSKVEESTDVIAQLGSCYANRDDYFKAVKVYSTGGCIMLDDDGDETMFSNCNFSDITEITCEQFDDAVKLNKASADRAAKEHVCDCPEDNG